MSRHVTSCHVTSLSSFPQDYSHDVQKVAAHHHMAVNGIQWNPFNANLYLTGMYSMGYPVG